MKRIAAFSLMVLFRLNSTCLAGDFPLINIGKQVFVYEDTSAVLQIEDILSPQIQSQFTQSKLQVPNFKTLGAAGWVKFDLKVPASGIYYLQIEYALLYSVDFYAFKGDSLVYSQKGGIKFPFFKRNIQSTEFYFPLFSQADTYYVKATSIEILQIPLVVGSLEDLFGKNLNYTFFDGIYFGFLILVILYNLFLFFSTRERVYGTYVLYVVAVGLVTGNLEGYNFQYLYPSLPAVNFYSPIFYPLNYFVLLFAMEFLNIKEKAPRYLIGFQILIAVCVLEIVFGFIGYPALMFQVSQGVGLLVVGYILFVAGLLYLRGYQPAKFFLLAFTMFLLGIAITIMLSTGLIEYSFYAYHSIQIGSAIEVVLLSFAIADKINTYKKDKEVAQSLALVRLKENEKLIKEQNIQLELKVKERTEEIELQNHQLLQKQYDILSQTHVLKAQNQLLVSKESLIVDSLNYALRIQSSALGKPEVLKGFMKNVVIFYRPKDIVSGDFYWFSSLGEKALVAAIDCTGHGVPGAFMTMMTAAFLEEIVNRRGILEPDLVLKELDGLVFRTLNQQDSKNQDGMDAAICLYDRENSQLLFAGAKMNLDYFENDEMKTINGERTFIGGTLFKNTDKILLHRLNVRQGITFFMYSDGYADQFGSEKLKRFGFRRFREVLMEIHKFDAYKQEEILHEKIEDWMSSGKVSKQTDDILVLGLRI